MNYQNERWPGKKSEDSLISGSSWDGWEPDTRNVWRCRRWEKWTRTKQENWLVSEFWNGNNHGGFPAAIHV